MTIFDLIVHLDKRCDLLKVEMKCYNRGSNDYKEVENEYNELRTYRNELICKILEVVQYAK